MARRIARDAVVTIAYGGFDDGTPTWGTATAIQGVAESIEIEESVETVDVAGLGEFSARMRAAGGARRRITMSNFIPGAGFSHYQTGGMSPVGYYARVEVKPDSTLSTPYQYTGIIERWQWSANRNDRQVERIEIVGPIDE